MLKVKIFLLCILTVGCNVNPEDPSIEYYTVISNRSAEYHMYNQGSTTKQPTYWGKYDSKIDAENAAQNEYDNWLNKMWRPDNWTSPDEQQVIYVYETEEVVSFTPEQQSQINSLESQIDQKDQIITSLESQIASMKSCSLSGVRLEDGESAEFYTTNLVAWNEICPISNIRTCSQGTLYGNSSAVYSSCRVEQPRNCTLSKANTDSSYEYASSGVTTVLHGESIVAYQKSNEPYTCFQKSIVRQCVDGTLSGDSTYRFDNCGVGNIPNDSRLSRQVSCPAITKYNEMNTHNYPSEMSHCKSVCFDRRGYFGSLLPESSPTYFTDVDRETRSSCYECEMSNYSEQCFYPKDQFYVFRYYQKIDPKETFSLEFGQ